MTLRLGILYDRAKWEEKALKREAERRGLKVSMLNILNSVMRVSDGSEFKEDVYIQRSLSFFKGLYSTAIIEHHGKTVVNSYRTSVTCGNKLLTTLALVEHGVPTPRTVVAFSEEGALKAVETLGYPAVLKPIHGSWGRLVAILNDPSSAKAIVESRAYLHPIHRVFYIQEFVERPPRDIRSFVVGDRVVAAMYRVAPRGEWRTNVMRGGRVEVCPITDELEDLSLKAAEAVGGGVLGVDIMEGDNGLIVHEVNHVPGFANTARIVEPNLPGLIVEYAVELAKR